MAERAVFLDCDGTIAKDVSYCSHPKDFQLLPGVAEGIRLLNDNRLRVVVVTNQSGIARGYFTHETLTQIHQKMKGELAKQGAWIDAIYYCPYHPKDGCECRKPKPGLLLRVAQELDIDFRFSYMVGDAEMDIKAAKAVGYKTVSVAASLPKELMDLPDHVASTFLDAAR